jgi:hypothetical protein
MHDLIYQSDIFKMMGFVSRTCIKWDVYRTRQERFLKLLNKDESDEEAEPDSAAEMGEKSSENQFFRVVKSKTEVIFYH